MLEHTKINPWATRFKEIMRRNSAPMAIVSGSLVKARSHNSGRHCANSVKSHHHGRPQQYDTVEGFLHPLAVSGAEILPGDGAGRERNGNRRHVNDAEQARTDAEAGLRRSTEIPEG